jgi:hypothetical protein
MALSVIAYLLIPDTPYWLGLHSLQRWWAYHLPFQYSGFAIFAGILGPCGAWFLNRIGWNYAKTSKQAIQDYGGPLEKLLFRALTREKYVMVTLRSGKVYIGRVTVSLAPQDETAFSLLPIKSGYREAEGRLCLTTHYDEVYERIYETEPEPLAKEMIADFGVVIPVREVVSASLYRDDVHRRYFPHSDEPHILDP